MKNKPPGSFLFRFSLTTLGQYVISVSREVGVGHWRITQQKITRESFALKIEDRVYRSFHEIVETHEYLPLECKSQIDKSKDVYLKFPCDREKDMPSNIKNTTPTFSSPSNTNE